MLTVSKVYNSVRNTMQRILIELDESTTQKPFTKYFGISARRYLFNVLLQHDPARFRADNYGRKREWIIRHKYARDGASLKLMGLPLHELLHYTMWEICPVNRVIEASTELNRMDYVIVARTNVSFELLYGTLFEYSPNHREKCSKINRLVRKLLQKEAPDIQNRHIALHLSQYNHIVRRIQHVKYYDCLKITGI